METIKLLTKHVGRWPASCGLLVLLFLLGVTSCNKNAEVNSMDPTAAAKQASLKNLTVASLPLGHINETILVANLQGLGAEKTDPVLVNAWGLAIGPDNAFWVACNHSGLAEIYGADGHRMSNPIDIPLHGVNFASSPSGVVYNSTEGFVIASTGQTAKYIFATEDGIISAWSDKNTAVTVADRSSEGANYKGLALARNGHGFYVYAANFHSGAIDVFDESFNYVSDIKFSDAGIPRNFAPFNIKNIDGRLFVTYAMQKAGTGDDQAGAGNGYVDVFNPDGSLVMRFASQGALNSPWGMVETETQGEPEHLLVGNFGDGRISVFDMRGNYIGQLGSQGKTAYSILTIPGLWALEFRTGDEKEFEHSGQGVLYFTAGPSGESQGLFGYLSANKAAAQTTVTAQQVNPVTLRQ